MPIPDYQSCMLPLLRISLDGKEHHLSEAVRILSDQFNLTNEEREEVLPSGAQFVISNRIGWARTYLYKAGLLGIPKRGFFQITDRGNDLLRKNPAQLGVKELRQFDEFVEFEEKSGRKAGLSSYEGPPKYETPEEALEYGYQKLAETLSDELQKKIMECSPSFFERLVVDLMVRLGYGGSLKEAARDITGKPGDEGIDGIIKEDKLGLDAIYIQAKRWNGTPVGRPEIQKFAGALLGKKARKGVFITTSKFTQEALAYVKTIDAKIVLIDGDELTRLMIEHNLGANTTLTYEIKRIDSDYFEEEH